MDTSFTSMWMADPTLFDPSQAKNRFSLFNDNPLPWPPSYVGVPTNAGTGQPIAGYKPPPPTPAAPQAPIGTTLNTDPQLARQMMGAAGNMGQAAYLTQAANQGGFGGSNMQPFAGQIMGDLGMRDFYWNQGRRALGYPGPNEALMNGYPGGLPGQQQAPAATGSPAGAPNNWDAVLSALANPGNPQTPGPRTPIGPMQWQPSNGVTDAFLASRGWGPTGGPSGTPTNAAFMNALAGLQRRPTR